jgi:signal transduction histidine kinase
LIREKEEVKFNLQEYIMNEEQNILHEHLDKCSKDKENVISVVRLKYPDGSTQQIQITSVPSCKWSEKDCFLTIFQELKNYSGTNDVFTRLEELNLVGKIAGSVAHEVRNPLTVVRGHLQLLGWDKQLEKYHEQLETMITEIDRAVEILTELLYMSRPSKTRMERENINTILNHLYQLLNAEALVNLHEVVYELEEVPDVMLDKKRFRQVVLNLVNNGLQAMEEHSRIIIKTFTSAGKVYFAVKDHGKGIPPEVLKKIGTPFLTTKANGTGLGLSACYNIIADHRASMEVDTGPEGTTFTIIFDAIV